MPLYWLCYRHNNSIFVVIEPAYSLIHARLRASLDGLDQGQFTEGHKLPSKWKVAKQMMGDGYRRRKRRGCWRSSSEGQCLSTSTITAAVSGGKANFNSSASRDRLLDPHRFRPLGKLVVGNLDRIADVDNIGN